MIVRCRTHGYIIGTRPPFGGKFEDVVIYDDCPDPVIGEKSYRAPYSNCADCQLPCNQTFTPAKSSRLTDRLRGRVIHREG